MIDKTKYEKMVKDSTPGRYEGETAAMAYYEEMELNGDGDFVNIGENEFYTIFLISPEESNVFEINTNDFPFFCLWRDGAGFVYGREITKEENENIMAEHADYITSLEEEI